MLVDGGLGMAALRPPKLWQSCTLWPGVGEFSQPGADAWAENLVLPRPREHQPLLGDLQGAAQTGKAAH